MHSCFLIPELVLHIIYLLADDRPAWHDNRYLKNARDVARLARTCKALANPALDVLWKTQHSLAPLVMCLPQDFWKLTGKGKSISFLRDPTPSEWTSIHKYAHRICSISQPASFMLPRLDDAGLATLLAPSNFGPLFRSLRFLDFTVISVSAPIIPLLTNVLSTEDYLESIRSLCVTCPRASQQQEVYNLFQAIRNKATRLEFLRIESYTSAKPNLLQAVTLAQSDLKFLRRLELNWTIHVSAECLSCLIRMRDLQELSVSVRHDIGVDFLVNACSSARVAQVKASGDRHHCGDIHGPTFPALKSLKVTAHSLDQCTALISLVTSTYLDNISCSYDVQAPSSSLEAFFRQLQRTCGYTTGTSIQSSPLAISLTLKHNLGPFSSPSSPFIIHPSQTLSPLLSLPNLRILRLLQLGTIALDDAFLRQAACAWGEHLQELEECGIPWAGVDEANIPREGSVGATLSGIGVFVSHCPRLERLRVAFDARGVPGWNDQDQDQDVLEMTSALSLEDGDGPEGETRERRDNTGDVIPEDASERTWTRISPMPSSALQVLNVRDSPIDDPDSVAKFLKRVAPALRVICVEGSLDMWRKWREVEDRMKLAGPC